VVEVLPDVDEFKSLLDKFEVVFVIRGSEVVVDEFTFVTLDKLLFC